MEHEGSLPHSQVPATCPYPEPAPFELSTQQALLKVPYDFHMAGNGLYTMLVTTLKDSKTSKHVSILYQL